MEDITKVDVPKFMEQHSDDNFLSQEDIEFLRVKAGKNKLGYRDCLQIEERLAGHALFALVPGEGASFLKKIGGYLVDGNSFMLFTNLEDCKAYLNQILEQKGAGDWKIQVVGISFAEVMAFAREYQVMAAVDYRNQPDARFLIYDGRQRTWMTGKSLA